MLVIKYILQTARTMGKYTDFDNSYTYMYVVSYPTVLEIIKGQLNPAVLHLKVTVCSHFTKINTVIANTVWL